MKRNRMSLMTALALAGTQGTAWATEVAAEVPVRMGGLGAFLIALLVATILILWYSMFRKARAEERPPEEIHSEPPAVHEERREILHR